MTPGTLTKLFFDAVAAELDFQVAADQLECDFLARIARGEINLAEPATTYAAFDRVAFQRPRAARVRKLHRRGPGTTRNVVTLNLVELGRR